MSEPSGCSRCSEVAVWKLYAVVDGTRYCARCWRKAGRPWPRRASDPGAAHQAELRTRGKMLKRGGPDRHLARNNRT